MRAYLIRGFFDQLADALICPFMRFIGFHDVNVGTLLVGWVACLL